MSRKVTVITVLAFVAVFIAHAGEVLGQEPDADERPNTRQIEEDIAAEPVLVTPIHYGVGLRLRYVFVPKFIVDLAFEDTTGGIGNPGIGLDFVRRRGDFELTIGLEWESLSGTDGFFLETGDDAVSNGETPDFVDFDGFGWLTLDANFVFHKQLGKSKFSIRYGGGFGIGLVLGEILQTDSACTGRDINGGDCMKNPFPGGQVDDPANAPPVLPVINALAGVQYRPTEKIVVNAELGIRTAPFIGLSSQYMF